jgi:hypothetical protein
VFYPCWADNSNSTGDNPAGANSYFDLYTAKVTLGGKPVIAGIQPTNLVVLMNQPATFTATVSGSDPLAFQWRHNGANVSGISNIFFLPAAQPGDSGNYSVIVTNGFGAATSSIVTLTVIPTVPLPFALNDTLTWTVDPVSPWYGQTNISYDGVAAAQTFFLTNGGQTRLRTAVTGPGTLTYRWKVSSQTNADILSFLLDGGTNAQISGEVGWLQRTNYLTSGSHNLQWVYTKDATGASGQDAAWLDQVIYNAGGTAPFILSQPSDATSFGTPATFTVGSAGTPALAYQWRLNGTNIPGATSSSFTVPGPLASDAGAYSVRITNQYGSIISSDAVLTVVPLFLVGDDSLSQLGVTAIASNAIAVAAGAYHTLVLRADGIVVAYGNNADGECDVPPDLTEVADIAAGGYHSVALKTDQTVRVWGADFYGQVSGVPALTNAIAIAAGTWHSLALRANGTVVAWGDDAFGQLDVPVGLSNVVAIAAGGTHSMALRANGTVVAWGDNEDANGNFVGQSVVPPGLNNIVAIAAGNYHSLAVKANGTLVAWGDNSYGQADPPPNLTNIVAAAGGSGHSLALKADGTVTAWGNNLQNQCAIPVNLSNVVLLAAGEAHTLLLVTKRPTAPQLLHPVRGKNRFTALLQTFAGNYYAFETKTNLAQPAWTGLRTNYGTGVMQFLIDPAATSPSRFYRVRQW